jgi:CRISPR-associated protein Csb2
MDVAAKEWRAGRAFDVAVLRTMKAVNPYKLAATGPHLLYRWRGVEIESQVLQGLQTAADCLHTLGWGIDAAFASMDFGDGDDARGDRTRWRPVASGGRHMMLPTEGSLDDLQDTYGRFLSAVTKSDVNPDTRPTVYRQERYASLDQKRECIYFDLRPGPDEDKGDKGFSWPAMNAMHVAAWMRHAVSQALLKEGYPAAWVNAEALGHGEAEARLSYVPMPSVGHSYVDGRIRRVMISQEAGGDTDVMRVLQKKLTGLLLTDENGEKRCRLAAPLNEKVRKFYVEEAKNWRTVTPVVLHGFNAQRGEISLRKTERLLEQAFEKAGWDLEKVERVAFQAAPFFRGTEAARRVRVPKHLDRYPRYHVAIDFRTSVEGPLLAGLGQHYGIGVFARAI